MNFKLPKLTVYSTIAIIGIIAVITGIVVAAAYQMNAGPAPGTSNPTPSPSPTASPTPIPQATMTLTLSPTTVTVGQSWTLTATVSDSTQGITVTFHEDSLTGPAVGAAVTNAAGVATLVLTPTLGSHVYYATATHP